MASVRVSTRSAALTAGFALLLLSACGSDGGAPPPAVAPDGGFVTPDAGATAAPPSVDLGAGLTAYRDLADEGETIELVRGPQGGWHIDLGVRVRGFAPDDLGLTYTATTSDRVFGQVRYEVRDGRKFRPTVEGWVRPGDRVVFDIADPSEVVGRELTVSVALDVGQLVLRDSRRAAIVDEM